MSVNAGVYGARPIVILAAFGREAAVWRSPLPITRRDEAQVRDSREWETGSTQTGGPSSRDFRLTYSSA